jgi:hypothetical protein
MCNPGSASASDERADLPVAGSGSLPDLCADSLGRDKPSLPRLIRLGSHSHQRHGRSSLYLRLAGAPPVTLPASASAPAQPRETSSANPATSAAVLRILGPLIILIMLSGFVSEPP